MMSCKSDEALRISSLTPFTRRCHPSGIGVDDLSCRFSPIIASTGLRDICVLVKEESVLWGLAVDFPAMSALSEEIDVVGVHMGAMASRINNIPVRNFAPKCGIDEESATGTSNCAMACALAAEGLLTWGGEYTFVQEDEMGAPSRIIVRLGEGKHDAAWVGGKFRVVIEEGETSPLFASAKYSHFNFVLDFPSRTSPPKPNVASTPY